MNTFANILASFMAASFAYWAFDRIKTDIIVRVCCAIIVYMFSMVCIMVLMAYFFRLFGY